MIKNVRDIKKGDCFIITNYEWNSMNLVVAVHCVALDNASLDPNDPENSTIIYCQMEDKNVTGFTFWNTEMVSVFAHKKTIDLF